MPILYVRFGDGSDSDDGSTWALAKATLAGAFAAASAGDTIYVSDNHAETQSFAMTLTSPGTAASPVTVICADDAAEPPTARATSATISTTGGNQISFAGFCYCYGITFSGSSGATTNMGWQFAAATPWAWHLEACSLRRAGTNSGDPIIGAAATTVDDQFLRLTNTTLHFGHANDNLILRARMEWRGTANAIGGTTPTTLFGAAAAFAGQAWVYGVDLSALASGKSLVDLSGAAPHRYRFANCKLGSEVAITTGTHVGQGGAVVEVINCDSADTNYRYYYEDYAGTITQETTIVRTGGASDGTTPISYKFVTTANSKWYFPLCGPWVTIWNETTGSGVTLTAEVVTDNVTLTDAEAWIEVEHLGTSGFPLSLTESDQITDPIFGTPANQTSSSETWTTTGLTTPVKQALSKQVTPQEKGPIRARVVLAKASTTMYADLKLLA
jgi:hypothetical protein